MAIKERVSFNDVLLYELLRHPVLCGEFIDNIDRMANEREIVYTEYQKEFACDFSNHVSISCARAVGKCLEKDSRLLNADTGEYLTVETWYNKQKDIVIPSINEKTYNQTTGVSKIFDNGIQDIIEINTKYGYKTKVTEEHPFLTQSGWKKAIDLTKDDFIAVPSKLEYFGDLELDDLDVIYLGYFISEGCRRIGAISTSDFEVSDELQLFTDANDMKLSIRGKNRTDHRFSGLYRADLLDKYGIRDCYSYEKYIPNELFRLNKRQLGILLNRLFSGDGWVSIDKNNSYEVGYSSSSEQLARDIKHLLLRFGIFSSLSFSKNLHKGRWNISIKNYESIINFHNSIGFVIKRKQEVLESILETFSSSVNDTNDIIPLTDFKKYKVLRDEPDRPNQSKRMLLYKPTRQKASRIINKDEYAEKMLNSDVRWVKVNSIRNIGQSQTYSIEQYSDNTLVADDIYSHNSFMLRVIIIWLLINNAFPTDYIVYTVPNKAQLEPVWNILTRSFRTNSFLKNYLEQKKGVNSSSYQIKLLNGSILICRIAGQSGDGVNVIGLHTPFVMVDEGGYYSWGTWQELQPIVNTWQDGYRVIVSGVPTGLRENNVLYHVDQENTSYTKHNIAAFDNPRFTDEDEERAIQQYGGRDSEDYAHFVLGQHGAPIFAVFDRRLLKVESYPVYKLTVDGISLRSEIKGYFEKIQLIPPVPRNNGIIFGVDLGYTDPTAIVIMYLDDNGLFKFHARIQLNKVSYNIQDRLLDALDTKFKPMVIGVDEGNAGKAVIQRLNEADEFLHKNYKKRLIPINFSTSTIIGVDLDGNEIKSRTKPFSVSILQDYSNNHRIIYSTTDPDMVSELERMTYVKNSTTGDIAYKTLTPRGGKRGDDHFTAALLSGMMAYYLENETLSTKRKPTKLFRSRWL